MLFIDNKYYNWYCKIISNARLRSLSTVKYTERHHIIPRSFGGNNKKENIVKLTAREHFICHWLLIKCTTGDLRNKMIQALHIMQCKNSIQSRYSSKITSKVYSLIRVEYANIVSKNMKGKTGRLPWNKGKQIGPHSAESNRLKSEALKNKFTGSKNPAAKTYIFEDPYGKEYIVTGRFKYFCLEHQLSFDTMRRALNNKKKTYHGWLVKYFNSDK